MLLTGLIPSVTQAATFNSAQVSLEGPLKNYAIPNKIRKRIEEVVNTLKKRILSE